MTGLGWAVLISMAGGVGPAPGGDLYWFKEVGGGEEEEKKKKERERGEGKKKGE